MGTRGQLAFPSDSTVEGGPGLVLDNVLDSVPEGALGSQLVHVDLGGGEGGVQRSVVHVNLLSLVPSLHLHGDLLRLCVFYFLEYVQGGGEYWQSQRTGSSRQSSQSRLSR